MPAAACHLNPPDNTISSQVGNFSIYWHSTGGKGCHAATMLKSTTFRHDIGGRSSFLSEGRLNWSALYTMYQHGSTDRLPHVTMGSGSWMPWQSWGFTVLAWKRTKALVAKPSVPVGIPLTISVRPDVTAISTYVQKLPKSKWTSSTRT